MLKLESQLPEKIESLATSFVDAVFKVHCNLGPGLLESIYETCLARELGKRSVIFQTQVPMPVVYDGEKIDCGFRLDMLLEDKIIVEIKAVEEVLPVHKAQILTYLKITNLHLGFLINFNVPIIKNGIQRIVR